jgi:hypothetical protein
MSWWDYGYQITAMANRTVIVDNNTWNNTHISRVGQVYSPHTFRLNLAYRAEVRDLTINGSVPIHGSCKQNNAIAELLVSLWFLLDVTVWDMSEVHILCQPLISWYVFSSFHAYD